MHTFHQQELERGRTWLHAVNMTHTFCRPEVKQQSDSQTCVSGMEIAQDVDTNETVLLHLARFAGTSTFDTQHSAAYISQLYAYICPQ